MCRCVQPRSRRSLDQSCDSNLRPQSVVIMDGIPICEIQPEVNVKATASAVMSGIGKASGRAVSEKQEGDQQCQWVFDRIWSQGSER